MNSLKLIGLLGVPLSIAFVLIGAWLVARVLTRRSREIQRRYKEGRCLNCGYDLRTNPQGRCPECGKFI